jgi:hypothetical protein
MHCKKNRTHQKQGTKYIKNTEQNTSKTPNKIHQKQGINVYHTERIQSEGETMPSS